MIVPAQEMNVIRCDQTDAEIFRDLWQHTVALMLLFDSVIVHFDEEIFRAENVAIFRGGLLRLLNVVPLNRRIHFARETPAEADVANGYAPDDIPNY